MIVERSIKTYYAIAIAALSDLLKYLAPDFKPMRSQKKNNGILYVWFFSRFEQTDWFIVLFAPVVIGRGN